MLAVSLVEGTESARGMSLSKGLNFSGLKYACCRIPGILGTTLSLKCRDDPSVVNSRSSVTGVRSSLDFDALNVYTVSVSDPVGNWSFSGPLAACVNKQSGGHFLIFANFRLQRWQFALVLVHQKTARYVL